MTRRRSKKKTSRKPGQSTPQASAAPAKRKISPRTYKPHRDGTPE